MKKILLLVSMLFVNCLFANTVVDVYRIQINTKIPKIINNMQSTGYRKYTNQKLYGELRITYNDNDVSFCLQNLVNKSHLINGKNVTYICQSNDEYINLFNYIGNNLKNKFITPSISFSIIADPSYNIGEVAEDNSLYLWFSGNGVSKTYSLYGNTRIPNRMSGKVVGTIGCGCSAYGHISPTRTIGPKGATDNVIDTASVFGTWTALFKYRITTKQ